MTQNRSPRQELRKGTRIAVITAALWLLCIVSVAVLSFKIAPATEKNTVLHACFCLSMPILLFFFLDQATDLAKRQGERLPSPVLLFAWKKFNIHQILQGIWTILGALSGFCCLLDVYLQNEATAFARDLLGLIFGFYFFYLIPSMIITLRVLFLRLRVWLYRKRNHLPPPPPPTYPPLPPKPPKKQRKPLRKGTLFAIIAIAIHLVLTLLTVVHVLDVEPFADREQLVLGVLCLVLPVIVTVLFAYEINAREKEGKKLAFPILTRLFFAFDGIRKGLCAWAWLGFAYGVFRLLALDEEGNFSEYAIQLFWLIEKGFWVLSALYGSLFFFLVLPLLFFSGHWIFSDKPTKTINTTPPQPPKPVNPPSPPQPPNPPVNLSLNYCTICHKQFRTPVPTSVCPECESKYQVLLREIPCSYCAKTYPVIDLCYMNGAYFCHTCADWSGVSEKILLLDPQTTPHGEEIFLERSEKIGVYRYQTAFWKKKSLVSVEEKLDRTFLASISLQDFVATIIENIPSELLDTFDLMTLHTAMRRTLKRTKIVFLPDPLNLFSDQALHDSTVVYRYQNEKGALFSICRHRQTDRLLLCKMAISSDSESLIADQIEISAGEMKYLMKRFVPFHRQRSRKILQRDVKKRTF